MTKDQWISGKELLHEYAQIRKAQRRSKFFGPLYDKYFETIFQYIYRRTGDESLTADLTSQTFLNALTNIKKYKFTGVPFSSWLYRIASNEINKDHLKNKRSRNLFSLEEYRFHELLKEFEEETSLDLVGKLVIALEELPDDVLVILELRFFEEKGFKEISYILGISESAAKMKTYRALNKLKVTLEGRKV